MTVKALFRPVKGTFLMAKIFPRENSHNCYLVTINSFVFCRSTDSVGIVRCARI